MVEQRSDRYAVGVAVTYRDENGTCLLFDNTFGSEFIVANSTVSYRHHTLFGFTLCIAISGTSVK